MPRSDISSQRSDRSNLSTASHRTAQSNLKKTTKPNKTTAKSKNTSAKSRVQTLKSNTSSEDSDHEHLVYLANNTTLDRDVSSKSSSSKTRHTDNSDLDSVSSAISEYTEAYGMKELGRLSMITIQQDMTLEEALCCWKFRHTYLLSDPTVPKAMPLFKAEEYSRTCNRMCCGAYRSFTMTITDRAGRTMFTAERRPRWGVLCCAAFYCLNCSNCCKDRIEVKSFGRSLGFIREEWSCQRSFYNVYDGQGQKEYMIQGPLCTTTCCCPGCRRADFDIYRAETEVKVGVIFKQFNGVLNEALTDADLFVVEFPTMANADMKTLFIAATFLIDMIHFSSN